MKRIVVAASAILLMLFSCQSAAARHMEKFEKNIPGDRKVKTVNLETDIGLARLLIRPHDGSEMLASDVHFDADKFRVEVEYQRDGDIADIFLFSEQIRRKLDLDSDDNDWRVTLSRDYVWDIDMEIGFAECFLDLSGLSISRLVMDIGASECDVEFDQPNPQRMTILDIDAGAGELTIDGLGNANFEEMRFDGGAGEFVLNFEGNYTGRRTAQIDVGVGAVRLELPRGLPVRIETTDSWLSSLNVRGARLNEIGDGIYETKDFDKADYGLEIDVDLGIGEVEITWVK